MEIMHASIWNRGAVELARRKLGSIARDEEKDASFSKTRELKRPAVSRDSGSVSTFGK